MKIAFLFLVISHIYHEDSWINFFANGKDNYSVYIHAKEPFNKQSPFKKHEIRTKVPTSWTNTMQAQVALLKEALKDPRNQKFVFVSESTIPLKPFSYVYNQLSAHDSSQFWYIPNPHEHRTFLPLKKNTIYKNSQWLILNRKHAHVIVNDTEILPIFARNPFDNEHYPSTVLAYNELLNEVIAQDATFVLWPNKSAAHPHTFESIDEDPFKSRLIKAVGKKQYLFARKFHKQCSVDPLIPYMYHAKTN